MYINCRTEGIPPPSILWMKEREPLLDFPYRNIRELSNGRQLEVRNVQISDEGRYRCVATNVAGQKQKDFKVKVLGKSSLKNVSNELSKSLWHN